MRYEFRRCVRRRGAALIVCIALTLASGACKRQGPVPFPTLAGDTQFAGGGIEVQARFLPGAAEIEQLFKKNLPDSGVVPVQVALRNNDVVPLVIYPPSAPASGIFPEGISLRIGGDTLRPLHPFEAAFLIAGSGSRVRPPGSGAGRIVAGTFLPPLGGYYLYRELKTGRYVRPLAKHSLHRLSRSGVAEPLTLRPGEEATGYLYFALIGDASPYRAAADSASAHAALGADVAVPACEIRLRAYRAREIRDSIPVFDASMPRRECAAPGSFGAGAPRGDGASGGSPGGDGASGDGGAGGPLVLALHESSAGRTSFGWGRFDALRSRFDGEFREIAPLSGSDMRFAGSVVCGSHLACAINFKGKSRIYLLGIEDGEAHLIEDVLLPRRTTFLTLTPERLIVVTNDGFGRSMAIPDLAETRSVKLGPEIKGVTRCGERLIVFDGMRGVLVYGASGDDMLREIGRLGPFEGPDRHILECEPATGTMSLLARGPADRGDTLVVLAASLEDGVHKCARIPLTAPVAAADAAGSEVLLQIDGGMLLRFDLGSVWGRGAPEHDGGISPVQGAYLPFVLRALSWDGRRIAGIGERGMVVSGALDDLAPDPASARESRSPVIMLRSGTAE